MIISLHKSGSLSFISGRFDESRRWGEILEMSGTVLLRVSCNSGVGRIRIGAMYVDRG